MNRMVSVDESLVFASVTSGLCVRFRFNPAAVNVSLQTHYCTSRTGTGLDDTDDPAAIVGSRPIQIHFDSLHFDRLLFVTHSLLSTKLRVMQFDILEFVCNVYLDAGSS